MGSFVITEHVLWLLMMAWPVSSAESLGVNEIDLLWHGQSGSDLFLNSA